MSVKKRLFLVLTVPIPFILLGIWLHQNHKSTIIKKFKQFINNLKKWESFYFNGRLIKSIVFISRWTIPTFYLLLFSQLTRVFYTNIFNRIQNPSSNLYILLLSLLFITFIATVFQKPRYLTSENSNRSNNEFIKNDLIFFDDKTCSTCQLLKPARSKHCKYCDHCVIFYDHHCVWVNNCIGRGNYQWFYSFLLLNCIVLTIANYLTIPIIVTNWEIIDELIVELCFLILMILFDLIVIWFTYENFKIIRIGMTTNEYSKWDDVQYLVELGNFYKFQEKFYEYLPNEDVFVSVDVGNNKVQHQVTLKNATKIESMHDIDNVYDLGSFYENLKERLKT